MPKVLFHEDAIVEGINNPLFSEIILMTEEHKEFSVSFRCSLLSGQIRARYLDLNGNVLKEETKEVHTNTIQNNTSGFVFGFPKQNKGTIRVVELSDVNSKEMIQFMVQF